MFLVPFKFLIATIFCFIVMFTTKLQSTVVKWQIKEVEALALLVMEVVQLFMVVGKEVLLSGKQR
jgi:ABC-type multidrug transport system permease subunit